MEQAFTEEILRLRAENYSVLDISKKLKLAFEMVDNVLTDKDNKRRLKEIENELLKSRKREYEGMYKRSIKALKDVLDTPHEIDVYDRAGNVTGSKISPIILKAKKEIASELLESMNIKKQRVGGGIQINTAIMNKTEKERKHLIQHKREVKEILGECTIEEGEKKCKEIMYAS